VILRIVDVIGVIEDGQEDGPMSLLTNVHGCYTKVVRGSIFGDSTQPIANLKIWTQPNPT